MHRRQHHKLGEQLVAEMGRALQASGMKLDSGTLVGASLVAAPRSTKREQKGRDFTNQRTRRKNRNKTRIRARLGHVFAMLKRLWGVTKVRYRGLAKHANRAFVALALVNAGVCRPRWVTQVRSYWAKTGPGARRQGPLVFGRRLGRPNTSKKCFIHDRFASNALMSALWMRTLVQHCLTRIIYRFLTPMRGVNKCRFIAYEPDFDSRPL